MGGFGPVRVARGEGSVTRLELFLDLIFVFAFLNVTGLAVEQFNPAGVPRGLLLLVLLWGCWAAYAWLGNVVRLDRGVMPLFIFGISATLFVMALTAREAFVDREGGLNGPVVFAVCYVIARNGPLFVATAAGVVEPGTRRNLRKAWPARLAGSLALLAAAILPDHVHGEVTREWVRFTLVACVIVADYAGTLLLGSASWHIKSISYWAERHSLIILIGFGEAIISIGLSQGAAVAQPLTVQVLAGTLLGVVLAGALWWTYFDIARFAAEQAMAGVSEARRTVLGRDAYSFLHLLMTAGLVLVALGLHTALYELRLASEMPIGRMGLLVLYGGVILYLVGLILFELRTLRLLGRSPVLGVILVGSLAPIALQLPVLVQVGLLTAAVGAMALADATVFRHRHRQLHAEIQPVLKQGGVTPKELFFDLVFVYAFLQVTAVMSGDPTWRGVVRGLLVLVVLWLAWCVYTWLGIGVRSEHPVVRLVMVLVVALTTFITLASPQAFNDAVGGLSGPLVFVACYALIRLLFLGTSWTVVVRQAPTQRASVARSAVPTMLALVILLAAALIPQPAGDVRLLTPVRAGLWLAAIAVDLVGNRLVGPHLPPAWSAKHWADRYSLIIIIALGQAVISMGTAAVYTPISAQIIVAAGLGTALLAALWWIYFSTTAVHGEPALAASEPARRSRLAADAYALLHLPMVAGVVLVALGLGKTMSVLGSQGLLDGAPVYLLPHFALFGGVIIYLLADQGFRWRLSRHVDPPRIAQTLVVTALTPATANLQALTALAILTAVSVGFSMIEMAQRNHEGRIKITFRFPRSTGRPHNRPTQDG
ncbi:low temperature requirement protein A [Micromonospora sp. L32]|uniref:low temperature requirement protein A n=1 Tax=Micromonospora sp. L32 TaxID=3452214 RepID=UPI003F89779D